MAGSSLPPCCGTLEPDTCTCQHDKMSIWDIPTGSRGYFLKGAGVLLNQALITYALQFAYKRGATPVQVGIAGWCVCILGGP